MDHTLSLKDMSDKNLILPIQYMSDEIKVLFLKKFPQWEGKMEELNLDIQKMFRTHIKKNPKEFRDAMEAHNFNQNQKNSIMRNIMGNGVASNIINNNEHIPICIYCDEPNKKARLCSGCDIVYYCNNTCQTQDWKNHKNLCDNGLTYKKLLKLRASSLNGDTSVEETNIISEIVLNRMKSQAGLNKLSPDLQEKEIIIEITLDMEELEKVITKSKKKALLKKHRSILYKKCVQCGQHNNLLQCGRCECVYYCSKQCQKTNWKIHKSICYPQIT